MRLKDKILSELMDEMDSQEGEKLKPKSMGVSITEVEPKMGEMGMEKPDSDMGMGDDDLKKLMQEYLTNC